MHTDKFEISENNAEHSLDDAPITFPNLIINHTKAYLLNHSRHTFHTTFLWFAFAPSSILFCADGYMSWMSKRLSFLLIFLILAYAFQFFNAYALYCIYQQSYCNEWQVRLYPSTVSLIFKSRKLI